MNEYLFLIELYMIAKIFQHKNFGNEIHDLCCLLINSGNESFHNNVNVGDKFLTGITNRYTRQSTDYSLQYKEFHFIPPALVVVEISTHLVRFPL